MTNINLEEKKNLNDTLINEQENPTEDKKIKKQKSKNSTITPICFFILGLGFCTLILYSFPINTSGKLYQSIFYAFLAIALILFVLFIVAFINAQKFYTLISTKEYSKLTEYSELFDKQRPGLKAAWKAYEKTLIDWILKDKDDNEICTKRTRTNSDLYFDGESTGLVILLQKFLWKLFFV